MGLAGFNRARRLAAEKAKVQEQPQVPEADKKEIKQAQGDEKAKLIAEFEAAYAQDNTWEEAKPEAKPKRTRAKKE